jgi:hypothetical protein
MGRVVVGVVLLCLGQTGLFVRAGEADRLLAETRRLGLE